MKKLHIANINDKHWISGPEAGAYLFHLGTYGQTAVLAYGSCLQYALDEVIDWCAENEPGLLANDHVQEAYAEAVAEGKTEEEAMEIAETDVTCGGNAGDYLLSYEWLANGPMTPKQIANFVHGKAT